VVNDQDGAFGRAHRFHPPPARKPGGSPGAGREGRSTRYCYSLFPGPSQIPPANRPQPPGGAPLRENRALSIINLDMTWHGLYNGWSFGDFPGDSANTERSGDARGSVSPAGPLSLSWKTTAPDQRFPRPAAGATETGCKTP